MLKWAFFDLGGTLLDDVPFHDHIYKVMLDILAEGGYKVSMQDFLLQRDVMLRRRGPVLRPLVKHFTDKDELVAPMIKELLMRIEGKGAELQSPYPESGAVLDSLKGRYALGVIANQQVGVRALLHRLGWDALFRVTLISDDVKLYKPDIKIFHMAIGMAECLPSEAVMVGDRIDNDVVPAKSIGMKTVRFRSGIFAPQEAVRAEETPDAEISSLSGLAGALEKLR